MSSKSSRFLHIILQFSIGVYPGFFEPSTFRKLSAEFSSAGSFSILLHLLGFSVVMINKTNGEDSTSVVKCSFVQLFCIDDSVKMKQLLDVERNE